MLPTARRAHHLLSKYESHGQWPRSHVWRNYVLDRQAFILNPSFARSGKLFLFRPHDVETKENQSCQDEFTCKQPRCLSPVVLC